MLAAHRLPRGAFSKAHPMNSTSDPPRGLTFGRLQVLPDGRELLADGRPVKLGGRAFDVLMVLIEARGAGVSPVVPLIPDSPPCRASADPLFVRTMVGI
jgi:DNA-binding response OmpR family regulator